VERRRAFQRISSSTSGDQDSVSTAAFASAIRISAPAVRGVIV
jgi:hypothetical protein